MKRIGIITLNDNNNYGNRLQNYSVYYMLSNLGYLAYNIENYFYTNYKDKYFFRRLKYFFHKKNYSTNKEKRNNFKYFNNNISQYPFLFNPYNKYLELDYFIVGSDQVWHPSFGLSNATVLSNISGDRKISFAASFGVNEVTIPKEYIGDIKNFKYISVREESGANIIKKNTGRNATVLVDPTMLLTKDEWRKVAKKPKGAKEGYILTYFLSLKCEDANNKLDEIKGNRTVYELLNSNDRIAGTAGPSEFLWLIDNAELILTDSFHACVFSFLFNKPFIVYDRNWDEGNMNSRLETLLSKFHLERKYANSGLDNDIWEHDYEEGYKQLEIERKKAMDFLNKALGE